MKPGGTIELADPPRPFLVLEHAGRVGSRHSRQGLWVLWQYDYESNAWVELAQATAPDDTWKYALRPMALFALHGGRPPEPPAVSEIAERLVSSIDSELNAIDPTYRGAVLGILEPAIAGRISAYL